MEKHMTQKHMTQKHMTQKHMTQKHQTLKSTLHTVFALSLTALLACNGSDDDNTQTGRLSYANLAGLTYETETRSGTTDSTGSFNYIEGETITFSLGNTTIGSPITAKSEISLEDLIPGVTLYTTTGQVRKLLGNLDGMNIGGMSLAEKKRFYQLANTLVLLHSLDADADPSNGIEIRSGVDSLLADTRIDLEKAMEMFPKNAVFRNAISQAAEEGLIASNNIAETGAALDHYYTENNITTNFSIIETRTDIFSFFSSEQIEEKVTYSYDENYNLTSIFVETIESGEVIRLSTDTLEYDEQSRLTRQVSDRFVETLEYDEFGNLISKTIIYDEPSEIFFRNSKTSYTYDENGNKLTETLDEDIDGQIDSTTQFTYDDDNRVVTASNSWNNEVYSVTTTTYNQNRDIATVAISYDSDAENDKVSNYTYDENYNLISYESSSGDSSSTYTYDDDGNQLTENYTADFSSSNLISETAWTSDEYGNILTIISNSTWTSGDITEEDEYDLTYTYMVTNWVGILKNKP
jgi:YD repeat-containing protein